MAVDAQFREILFGDLDRFREIKDFAISLAINVGFATLVVCAFTYLRPRNKAVYSRRTRWFKDDSKRPPEIPGDSVIGLLKMRWVHFIFNIEDSLILEKLGLDSLMFIRTLAVFVRSFSVIALVAAGVLIPVDFIVGTTFIQPTKQALALLTLENLEGNGLRFLWVHLGAAWLFNLLVLYFMYTTYCDFIILRQQWLTSHEHQRKITSRTLLCLHLPRALRKDVELERLFRDQIAAETAPPSCAAVGRRVGPLAELLEGHKLAVRKLELVLAGYFKGGKAASKRPTIRVKGRKEDAIEYWTCLIQNLEKKLDENRIGAVKFKPTDFGFVSFSSVVQAHRTAKVLDPPSVRFGIMSRTYKVKKAEGNAKDLRGRQLPEFILAPEPKDIVWSNLSLTPAARKSRRHLGTLLFLALCVLWIFPLTFVVSIAKLSALFSTVPALNQFSQQNPRIVGFLEQQIAPILQTLLIMVLPTIFRYITTFQAARTKTAADRAVLTKLYFFLVLTNVFFFALINVGEGIFTSVKKSIDAGTPISLRDFGVITIVTRELLTTGNHFLALVSVRGLLSQPLELAQAAALIGVSVKRWLFASTPRQDREFSKPPPMDFAVQYAYHLFIFTISFLFAPLVPLVAVTGLVYFVVSYHVYKYQCLYVFDTKVETGGMMWPLIFNRVLWAQVVAQLAMAAVLWARGGSLEAYSILPLVPITLGLQLYASYRLFPRTQYVAAAYPSFTIEGTPGTRKRGKKMIAAVQEFEYYDDSKAFSRTSLADRFMLPELARPLMTPMVREEVRSLLPEVYAGRLDEVFTEPSSQVGPAFSDRMSVYSQATSVGHRVPAPAAGGARRNRLTLVATQQISEELSSYFQRYNRDHDAYSDSDAASHRGSWSEHPDAYAAAPLDYGRVDRMFAARSRGPRSSSGSSMRSGYSGYTYQDYPVEYQDEETYYGQEGHGQYPQQEEYGQYPQQEEYGQYPPQEDHAQYPPQEEYAQYPPQEEYAQPPRAYPPPYYRK